MVPRVVLKIHREYTAKRNGEKDARDLLQLMWTDILQLIHVTLSPTLKNIFEVKGRSFERSSQGQKSSATQKRVKVPRSQSASHGSRSPKVISLGQPETFSVFELNVLKFDQNLAGVPCFCKMS